jgi:hypothetical protein
MLVSSRRLPVFRSLNPGQLCTACLEMFESFRWKSMEASLLRHALRVSKLIPFVSLTELQHRMLF